MEFTRIILENKSTIYTVCYMFSKDKNEIDDLFQEVLVRLWKCYTSFQRKADIKTWISFMAGIMAILTIPIVSLSFGLRTPFIIISIIWLVCMVAGNIIRNRNISPDLLSGESTHKFLGAIKKRKKVQFRWIQINLSLFVLWLGYFVGECIHSGMDRL